MIYAQQGTVMVQGRGNDIEALKHRVVWQDQAGHVHTTPWLLTYGEAHILADRLEHGEPWTGSYQSVSRNPLAVH
jgi:hypothetical protein